MSESGNGEQQTPGPQFNPQTGFPVGDPETPPAYQQPAYPQPPYQQQPMYQHPAQPPYGQNPYGAAPPYGQNPYGQQQQFGYPTYAPPNHPKATTALVLGLISTIGAFMCLLPALAGPFAWFTGAKARRQIRETPAQYGGSGAATAGMVLGIIGTVLLVLVVAGIVALIIWAASDPTGFSDYWDDGTTV
jgi:hypothetical protein